MRPHHFYSTLAPYWPLISPLEDYAEEAEDLARVLRERLPGARTLLELGCGGGHMAWYLHQHQFEVTLTDLSPEMLERARALLPDSPHHTGDMRTLRLAQTFDVVMVHDAITYMTSEDDLAAVFATMYAHCRPGGLAVVLPDETAETFAPSTDCGGSDAPDGTAIRFLEWVHDPDPHDHQISTEYSFILRDPDGRLQHLSETHLSGLFPRETWLRCLAAAGFSVEAVREHTTEDREPRWIFVGRRPAPPSPEQEPS